MDPTQGKPAKKRRRWLIAAFVLILVSTVALWFWPRGDARFVGKWRMVPKGSPEHLAVWIFRENGTGEFQLRDGRPEGEFDWSAGGDSYEMKMLRGPGSSPLQVLLYKLQRTLSRTRDRLDFEIISASGGSISIRPKQKTPGWGELTLHRIPE